VLKPAETQAMIYSILTQRQRERLEGEQELDCAHALPGKARFRLNVTSSATRSGPPSG
jgi:twitching motility protein PilT